MNTEKIEILVREKFNLPRFEMRFLSMTSKDVKDFVLNKKIEFLKEKAAKITEEFTDELNEIVNELPHIESSLFSYNIDRLKAFNDNLQDYTQRK